MAAELSLPEQQLPPQHQQQQQLQQQQRQQRKQALLQEFYQRTKLLLVPSDRDYLFGALKEYQMYRQLDKLLLCVKALLDTPAKLDLLRDVRHFVLAPHVAQYDRQVPYHKMAHPWQLTGHATMPRSKPRVYVIASPRPTPSHTPKATRNRVVNGSTELLAADPAALKVVTVVRPEDPDEEGEDGLGFSIRGGSENGLGIFVSEVALGSPAERAGLEPGDNIIEVNSVSFDNIASSSAVKVLTGSLRLKMLIRRVGKVPSFKSAKEKTSWYDVAQNLVTEGGFEERGTLHQPGVPGGTDGSERRVHLAPSRPGQHLGFNVRGGSEFGLNLYVSKVDRGGLAEQKGLRVGDQIVAVNDQNFTGISHARAVDVLKSQRQLVLTVKDVGKYPAFKEIFAEYRWVHAYTGEVTKTRSLAAGAGQISSVPVRSQSPGGTSHQTFTQYPLESRVESYAQTDDSSSGGDSSRHSATTVTTTATSATTATASTAGRFAPDRHETDSDDFYYGQEGNQPRQRQLLPQSKGDIVMRERRRPPQHGNGGGGGGGTVRRDPHPTLALRAMERETRKNHPDLAEEFDSLRLEALNHADPMLDSDDDLDTDSEKRYRTLKDIFLGSKSKGSKIKSSTQGAIPSKTRSRKPLSALNFTQRKPKDDTSAFERGLGSQLALKGGGPQHSAPYGGFSETAMNSLQNRDEVAAVVRHAKRYEADHDLDQLLTPLFAILDTEDKMQVFLEVRSVIQADDLEKFDLLLAARTDFLRDNQVRLDEHLGHQASPSSSSPAHSDHASPNPSPRNHSSQEQEEYRRHLAVRQRIEDQDRLKTFQKIQGQRDAAAAAAERAQQERYEVALPVEPDAKYDFEIHRRRSNSRVYKASPLDGEGEGEPPGSDGVRAGRPSLKPSPVNPHRHSAGDLYSGPFTLDTTVSQAARGSRLSLGNSQLTERHSDIYRETPLVLTTISPSRDINSAVGVYSSPQKSPVYATVNKERSTPRGRAATELGPTDRGSPSRASPRRASPRRASPLRASPVRASPRRASPSRGSLGEGEGLAHTEYMESAALYPVYQSLQDATDDQRAPGRGHQAVDSNPLPARGYGDVTDEYDVTEDLLVLADTSVMADSQFGDVSGADGLSMLGSPRSDYTGASSRASSRQGSYDINNPSLEVASYSDVRLLANRALPPTFIAPPPPITPPPGGRALNHNSHLAAAPDTGNDLEVVDVNSRDIYEGRSGRLSRRRRISRPSATDAVQDPRGHVPANGNGDVTIETRAGQDNSSPHRVVVSMSPVRHVPASPRARDRSPAHGPAHPSSSPRLTAGNGAPPQPPSPREGARPVLKRVVLSKAHRSLGLSISGGSDSASQPDVRVDKVFPGGAAAAEGTLKPGMCLLSVSGTSLREVTHGQAVSAIRAIFADKTHRHMTLTVLSEQ